MVRTALTLVVTLAACALDAPTGEPQPTGGKADEVAHSATFTIELVAREWRPVPRRWRTVALASFNPALAGTGLAFPATLTLGPDDGPVFEQLLRDVAAASEHLDRVLDFDYAWAPSSYPGLCYAGALADLPRTIDALRGSLFDTDMGIQAERHGTTTRFHYGADSEAAWLELHRELNPDIIALWETFDTTSTAYLMMTDHGRGGDGTELFGALIPRCE